MYTKVHRGRGAVFKLSSLQSLSFESSIVTNETSLLFSTPCWDMIHFASQGYVAVIANPKTGEILLGDLHRAWTIERTVCEAAISFYGFE